MKAVGLELLRSLKVPSKQPSSCLAVCGAGQKAPGQAQSHRNGRDRVLVAAAPGSATEAGVV